MEQFFILNCPWSKHPKVEIKKVMHPAYLIRWIILLPIFWCGCSEEEVASSEFSPYVPFPHQPEMSFSSAQEKKVDLSYFAKVEPGEFIMGSPVEEKGRTKDERQHLVKITKPYFISKFEITVKEWNELMPSYAEKKVPFHLDQSNFDLLDWAARESKAKRSPKEATFSKQVSDQIEKVSLKILESRKKRESRIISTTHELGIILEGFSNLSSTQIASSRIPPKVFKSKLGKMQDIWKSNINLPVTDVSYSQALQYCFTKTTEEHKSGVLPKGLVYRLPTEAEWEYACRAGNRGVCGLDEGNDLSGVNANINGGNKRNVIGKSSLLINRKRLIEVNRSNPRLEGNAWGIHEMHGNVMEWCYDFYGEYPEKDITIDPIGPIRGMKRVIRGGSFLRPAQSARSATRESLEPSWRGSEIGFRIVLGYPLR